MNKTPSGPGRDLRPMATLGWAAAALALGLAIACGGGSGSRSKPGAGPGPVATASESTILSATPREFAPGQEVTIELDRWQAGDEFYMDGQRVEILPSSHNQ
jgi:hypothetical protein